MTADFDFLVIGAGIAGASVAAHLASRNRVAVLEMEDVPGFHSTGRSAALYAPNYGPACIKALTRAARDFYFSPPDGFAEAPLVSPRSYMFLMPEGQEQDFAHLLGEQYGTREISPDEARRRFPLLRPSYVRRALLDEGTADMDVDQIHQGYLRLLRQRGGVLHCASGVHGLNFAAGRWTAATPHGEFAAPVVINAAGAWGEAVGQLAGARKIGLQPKRRSIAVISPPNGLDIMNWPMIGDVGESWYCKPQGGKFIVSPADETPVDPHDAYAEELTLAEGIDRFQQAVNVEVTHVSRTWAGLRSFVPDGNPVVGFDPEVENFFWLVGQGGYGIQSAPALSRLAAALAQGEGPPEDIMAEGLDLAEIAPERLAAA